MKLENPTDDELNRAFAEKVCGASETCDGMMRLPDVKCGAKTFESWKRIPEFTNYADEVLPWLEKMRDRYEVSVIFRKQEPLVWVSIGAFGMIGSCDHLNDFPRAAVIALLRAHGVEVEFTHET